MPEGAVSGLVVVTRPEETVYAIAAGRLWVSHDGTQNWQIRDAGFPVGRVDALAQDPERPERLWVMAADQLFVSDERSNSWYPVGRPLPEANTSVHGLAIAEAEAVIVLTMPRRYDPSAPYQASQVLSSVQPVCMLPQVTWLVACIV